MQSRRVVEVLENDGAGLNLTWEVRDGIEHHSGKVRAQTLEGQCVHLADRIASLNHDIADAIRGDVYKSQDLYGDKRPALYGKHEHVLRFGQR